MHVGLCIQVIMWKGRYVWAWMLIRMFVSDKQMSNEIRIYLRVSVMCLWVICTCMCVLVCECVHTCAYTLHDNMNMQSHLVFRAVSLPSVKRTHRHHNLKESLSNCMQIRQISLFCKFFFFIVNPIIILSFLLPSFILFNLIFLMSRF